ncbi:MULTISPECIES: hypothetical protein [Corallococcus]|uniref:hypothetical protein n=1 Tax=Corallococcus TaxID=83461 RepID=UPI00117F71F4|nr:MULTISPECIES: hypothetical protein [Corallococcus]NBD13055.1 hypothetical protein [Corallococcus silvisoli]TSC24687.1 hypothetical protein FOF48_26935 [Corallococcus sp. Z5C101001]
MAVAAVLLALSPGIARAEDVGIEWRRAADAACRGQGGVEFIPGGELTDLGICSNLQCKGSDGKTRRITLDDGAVCHRWRLERPLFFRVRGVCASGNCKIK